MLLIDQLNQSDPNVKWLKEARNQLNGHSYRIPVSLFAGTKNPFKDYEEVFHKLGLNEYIQVLLKGEDIVVHDDQYFVNVYDLNNTCFSEKVPLRNLINQKVKYSVGVRSKKLLVKENPRKTLWDIFDVEQQDESLIEVRLQVLDAITWDPGEYCSNTSSCWWSSRKEGKPALIMQGGFALVGKFYHNGVALSKKPGDFRLWCIPKLVTLNDGVKKPGIVMFNPYIRDSLTVGGSSLDIHKYPHKFMGTLPRPHIDNSKIVQMNLRAPHRNERGDMDLFHVSEIHRAYPQANGSVKDLFTSFGQLDMLKHSDVYTTKRAPHAYSNGDSTIWWNLTTAEIDNIARVDPLIPCDRFITAHDGLHAEYDSDSNSYEQTYQGVVVELNGKQLIMQKRNGSMHSYRIRGGEVFEDVNNRLRRYCEVVTENGKVARNITIDAVIEYINRSLSSSVGISINEIIKMYPQMYASLMTTTKRLFEEVNTPVQLSIFLLNLNYMLAILTNNRFAILKKSATHEEL